MRHIISILLQNESGALARVAVMFATRGFNIESLNVAPTEDESVSKLTLVTIGTDAVISQINQQLEKLIDVVAIADRTATDHIERELGLVKLRVEPDGAASFESLLVAHNALVLESDDEHVMVQITGDEREVDAFLNQLPEGVSLLSFVRSGPLVTSRGPHSLT
jgi:acetolactate synthase-1/3 small subunit